MQKNKDDLKEIIKEQFQREAAKLEKELQSLADAQETEQEMSAQVKARIRFGLAEQIAAYERERYDAAPALSEKERQAPELGRKLPEERTVLRRKKRRKRHLILVAVLVFVAAVGVNTIGEPKRAVEVGRSELGEREVTKVNSSDENLKITEDEEEAYQIVREEFGVEPVKLITTMQGMQFSSMRLDEMLQVAEFTYLYEDSKIIYLVSAAYRDSSLGIDAEDKVADRYEKTVRDCVIEVKEYERTAEGTPKYAAHFKYKDLEYVLIAMLEKEEFEEILKNLYFFA